jgi:peptide/nickel transport system permease protein
MADVKSVGFKEAVGNRAEVETPFRRHVSDFVESRIAVTALLVFAAIVLTALLAPWISVQNPYDLTQIDILDGRLPPGSKGMSGITYWLGTDDQGRDMLSAIFFGLRISLGVGAMSGLISMVIGSIVGVIAAYFGGKLDALLMRFVDLILGLPSILIALILLAVLGRGVEKVIIALVVRQWAYFARIVRGTALAEREKEYIEAARCLALSQPRILFRHLLPNCLPPVIVVGAVNVAFAIILEATLSFLGVGLPVTEPSLGLLIANGYEYILSGRYWISVFPGVALVITVASINIVTDRLRDVLNPRLQT